MTSEPSRKRGRPPGAPGHSLGEYLRRLRDARGWTVRDLARAAGLPSTSAGYISQLESGLKVPSADLARKLAKLLGDEQDIFTLWALTGKRADPGESALARRQLARLLDDPRLAHDPHFTHPLMARIESARRELSVRQEAPEETRAPVRRAARWIALPGTQAPPEPAGMARFMAAPPPAASPEPRALRVPLLPEGLDPTRARSYAELDALSGGASVRIEADVLRTHTVHLPFAYRLSEQGARRVPGLLRAGDVVIVTRTPGPIVPHEVYAVRLDGAIVLSLLMWNGRQLLLLPGEGEDDFVVLTAGQDALAAHVIGHVATVIRGAADSGA
jgi:transcriptional regulator with XRE-family HTH domain